MNDMPKKNLLSAQLDLSGFSEEDFVPATEDEKRQQDVMSESTTFFKDGMRKLFRNPLAVGSLVMLAVILVTIIVAPMVVPYRYEEILSVNGKRDKGAKNLAPFVYSEMEQRYIEQGGERFPHIFGTDEQCRDYFVRVIYGTRISLFVGFFASIIVLIIGMIYGSISGYMGGRTDLIGIGVKAPMPSLGSLANAAREGLQSYPYKLVFPAIFICLIVLSLNLLGDGLRDAFDPKLKR